VKKLQLSRRSFLRGVGGVALALPFLDAMRPARVRAETPPIPKRFVALFSPNGTIAGAWNPTGTENSFTLPAILAPLEAHKQDIVVLEGVRMTSTTKGPGSAHMKGVGHLLTGRELLEGEFTGGGGATSGWASGISVDQEMVNHEAVIKGSKFKSLQLGVRVKSAEVRGRISYRGAADPLPPEEDPKKAFHMLFGEAGIDASTIEGLKQDRQSVLDFVKDDFQRLDKQLGAEDRQKLDAHMSTISDIEKRVALLGTQVCTGPDMPAEVALTDANAPQISRLQIDILVRALACDLTRVASFMWMKGTSGHTFPWLDISDGHHDLSHEGDDNTTAKNKLVKINTWYSGEFAYLLSEMKKVVEADGTTLLDNSLLLWGNELGKGNSHSRDDIPFVLAGGCQGAIETGRYLAYDNAPPHNNLLLAALHAMGVPAGSFGDPEICTGPLANLLA
jgi:Protein of unknown function (DUF1552)